ncbi:AraC family transcriptional regulator [Myxococcus qinghaiensis]|uniref:AraC family transcriptional regulator n=1 Tax=Myxococcus qinghaiensis TaxID=2906758 RepID=UPI0020A8197B|nr:helix-turn-helix domain-containing protein [Myxococcus qinghaiensis]MCP3164091.1 helix-turn-helix domain-containing protein [Myxococcus qinghaiensis]
MTTQSPHARVVRQASEQGGWELVDGTPDARLREHVHNYCGYRESTPGPVRRRELPAPQVVLIIDFGPPLRIVDPRTGRPLGRHPVGFVAGLDDTYSVTETSGSMNGMQVNFTPVGARLFFGMPLHHLARQVVGLESVLGAEAPLLTERLVEAPSWEARFALVDQLLLSRILAAREVSPVITWTWQRLRASGGQVEIGELARELGFSQKHVIARCGQELGLTPKLLARLIRFDRVIQVLKSGAAESWARLALEQGYFDQAHLIRDFRQFTGGPPGEFLRRQLPSLGGTRAD